MKTPCFAQIKYPSDLLKTGVLDLHIAMQPVFNWSFILPQVHATETELITQPPGLATAVQLELVQSSPVSGFFVVHRTGLLNTRYTGTNFTSMC